MTRRSAETEAVVRHHLQVVLQGRGVGAVLADYADDARFCTEERVYRGEDEIGEFFTGFLGALPEDAAHHLTVRALQVDDDVAFLTWSLGEAVALGTDTFVVRDGEIVAQTFAMHSGARAGAAPLASVAAR